VFTGFYDPGGIFTDASERQIRTFPYSLWKVSESGDCRVFSGETFKVPDFRNFTTM
jgi:hypothetical protein